MPRAGLIEAPGMFTRFTFIRLFLWEHAAYGQPVPRSPPSVQRAVAGRGPCAMRVPFPWRLSFGYLTMGLLAFASPSTPLRPLRFDRLPPATVENWGLSL